MMKAVLVHDADYMEKDSRVYAAPEFSAESWQSYLKHFTSLKVIARRADNNADLENAGYSTCEIPDLSFSLYPSLTNVRNLVFKRREIARAIAQEIADADAVILRGGRENVVLAFHAAQKLDKPIALEATGCMWNNTWYYGTLSGKLYAPFRFYNIKPVFHNVDAVLYVTEKFLQERYPAKGMTIGASDVKLPPPDPEILQKRLSRIETFDENHLWKTGIIGPFHHSQKGIDVAIRALALWHKRTGKNFRLYLLGSGNPATLQALADRNDIGDRLEFCGTLPRDKVAPWLDSLDLYLQPSRTEGLPRATLEAMSRALPVISSDAGDLPNITDQAFIHPKGNANALSLLLEKMTADRNIMKQQSKRNFEIIETRFHPEILSTRREKFWQDFVKIVRRRSVAAKAA